MSYGDTPLWNQPNYSLFGQTITTITTDNTLAQQTVYPGYIMPPGQLQNVQPLPYQPPNFQQLQRQLQNPQHLQQLQQLQLAQQAALLSGGPMIRPAPPLPANPAIGDIVMLYFDGQDWVELPADELTPSKRPADVREAEFSLDELTAAQDMIEELHAGVAH